MLHRLVIALTLATACHSPAPPAAEPHTTAGTGSTSAEPTDTSCPAAPEAGAACAFTGHCDYADDVRCHCLHPDAGCPGGVQRPPTPNPISRWSCGPRPHPTCEAGHFEGACSDEGLTCNPACYVVATCTGGQWQVRHLPPPP